jgi:cell division protein FtsI/penicillin-binding protein 2
VLATHRDDVRRAPPACSPVPRPDNKLAAQEAGAAVEIPAMRGAILDCPHESSRTAGLVLTINRQEVGDDEEQILYRLSQVLGIPATELGDRLEQNAARYFSYTPVPVVVDVSKKVDIYIQEHSVEFRGVDVQELPVRTYPFGGAAAQVLGYLREISADKLDDPAFAGYVPGDLVGAEASRPSRADWSGRPGWGSAG